MQLQNKKISAVIACYNDALAIPHMYIRLTKVFQLIGCEYEIIFVNDGSPDYSKVLLNKLAAGDSHVVVVHHSRNFSSQMAFTSGMSIATGDAVILFDGDLQDPPELVPEFVKKWIEGYLVVYGIRVARKAPLSMQFAYKLFYRVFRYFSYVSIPVDAGDFSLLDRKVVTQLLSMPERDRFVRGLRAWVGFSQVGVEYVRPERVFGVTTNNILKNFQWATKGIFSFSYAPLQLMTLVSLGTFFLSLLGIVVQIILRVVMPDTPHGITTLLVVVLFIGAVQLLAISIIGEYIAKIFEEVKQRPQYIVEEIVKK